MRLLPVTDTVSEGGLSGWLASDSEWSAYRSRSGHLLYARGVVKFEMVANKYGDAITPAERDALVARHADIFAAADELVEAYANDGCAALRGELVSRASQAHR